MITIPDGWTCEQLATAIVLTHPNGPAAGRLHYRERGGEPRAFGVLAREIVHGWPQRQLVAIGPIERSRTGEGELAAMASLECRERGGASVVELGCVYTDDHVASIAGTTGDPACRGAIHQLVREVLASVSLGLGLRRRRFEYAPPADWQPRRFGLATEWVSPRFPRTGTSLYVHPANPLGTGDRACLENVPRVLESVGWVVASTGELERAVTTHGLPVTMQTVHGHRAGVPHSVRTALLSDASYDYAVELRSAELEDPVARAMLHRVVDSIVPFGAVASTTFDHWAA